MRFNCTTESFKVSILKRVFKNKAYCVGADEFLHLGTLHFLVPGFRLIAVNFRELFLCSTS